MWRPLDWAEVRQDVLENTKPWSGNITLAQAEGNFFEAGADAMLEALKKEGLTAEVIEKVFAKSNDTD